MQKNIISTIVKMCNNGTHSCKLHDVMKTVGCDKKQITDALQNAPFNSRLSRNINDITLIVIEED